MQNLVSKTRDAVDVNALGTGPGIVEHHGQSVIGLTEAASHLPLQYTTTDHEEQDQLATQVDGEVYKEDPEDWIYKVPDNKYERELETVSAPSVKARFKGEIWKTWRNLGPQILFFQLFRKITKYHS